jgi:hypothetical protein
VKLAGNFLGGSVALYLGTFANNDTMTTYGWGTVNLRHHSNPAHTAYNQVSSFVIGEYLYVIVMTQQGEKGMVLAKYPRL